MLKVKGLLLAAGTLFILNGCVTAIKSVATSTEQAAYASGAVTSGTCPSAGSLGAEYDAPVSSSALDQTLFDKAVLHFTNLKRCNNGLKPYSADSGLRRAASDHSSDMARLGFMSHESPLPGKKRFTDRIDLAGVPYSAAGENLARDAYLEIESGKPFFVVDKAACQFSYQQGGPIIQPRTYRSMAENFVNQWENSPAHRENLYSSKYTRLGSGAAFAPNARNCGDIYATQNFAA